MKTLEHDLVCAMSRANNGTADEYDSWVLSFEVEQLRKDVKMYRELLGLHETEF